MGNNYSAVRSGNEKGGKYASSAGALSRGYGGCSSGACGGRSGGSYGGRGYGDSSESSKEAYPISAGSRAAAGSGASRYSAASGERSSGYSGTYTGMAFAAKNGYLPSAKGLESFADTIEKKGLKCRRCGSLMGWFDRDCPRCFGK